MPVPIKPSPTTCICTEGCNLQVVSVLYKKKFVQLEEGCLVLRNIMSDTVKGCK